jgi:hypothetical protein
MTKNDPPLALVKTWVELINSNEDEKVRKRACQMLVDAFGDIQTAIEFCLQNNIQIN